MKIPVFSSKAAIRDYNKKLMNFQEIQARIRPSMEEEAQQAQPSLSSYLMQSGMPASFSVKSSLAKRMGVHNYTGSPEQDNALMMGMQGMDASKQQKKQFDTDTKFKEKEFGLKEKELGIKEKELETSKTPTAEEIASSLISKI
jgi:hypothetical protein